MIKQVYRDNSKFSAYEIALIKDQYNLYKKYRLWTQEEMVSTFNTWFGKSKSIRSYHRIWSRQ